MQKFLPVLFQLLRVWAFVFYQRCCGVCACVWMCAYVRTGWAVVDFHHFFLILKEALLVGIPWGSLGETSCEGFRRKIFVGIHSQYYE